MSKRKHLTADKLITLLEKICDDNNVDPRNVKVMFRRSRDSDPVHVTQAEEDLYDSETNMILESIMLFEDPTDI